MKEEIVVKRFLKKQMKRIEAEKFALDFEYKKLIEKLDFEEFLLKRNADKHFSEDRNSQTGVVLAH